MRAPLRPRELCSIVLAGVLALTASGSHVVVAGETLAIIARDHGTTVRELVEANGISDPDLILVGQELTIPGSEPEPVTYTVQRGDTLAGIAAAHGTTVAALVEANDLADPNLIRIGRDLVIEGAKKPAGEAPSGTADSSSPNDPGPNDPGPNDPGNDIELRGERHTVRLGDTIASIASRYGISATSFIRWNGLVDGRIYATTRLLLYDPGDLPSSGATGPSTHRVAAGETLSGIAGRYGTSTRAIVDASGIADPNRIVEGQQLTIPGGAGGFTCPVPGGSFFNDWAFPRSGGRSHAGIDIFAPMGTPVRAPAAGLVEVATGRIGGKQFRLTAADGTLWFGSHLSEFGERGTVSAGSVIGYVGDSGNARGSRPHLHFEVHPRGTNAVNPYPLLREVC